MTSALHLSDGTLLQSSWDKALSDALNHFRVLISPSSEKSWKPLVIAPASTSTPNNSFSSSKGYPFPDPSRLLSPSPTDVVLHKRSTKSGDVYRAVLDVPIMANDVGCLNIETLRGLLQTPEVRPTWDRMVEGASTIDILDVNTRINSTRYRLGWPSSPRDTITIAKTFSDGATLVDISTSLPRSPNEPAYLRPAPPYVRAHVGILAWCIQLVPNAISEGDVTPLPYRDVMRISCFWQWDPKGTWAVGGGMPSHLPSLLVGIVSHARTVMAQVPVLLGYGSEVSMGGASFDASRVTLSVDYAIVDEGEERPQDSAETVRVAGGLQGAEALQILKEKRRLLRAVEFGVSALQSWDVQIQVKTHNPESSAATWTSYVGKVVPGVGDHSTSSSRIILRFSHPKLSAGEDIARVKVSIERTSGNPSDIRINGIGMQLEVVEQRNFDMQDLGTKMLEDAGGHSGISLRSSSTSESLPSSLDEVNINKVSALARQVALGSRLGTTTSISRRRSPAEEKEIASLVKRNYIYFTSLLQEPEAKWKSISDSRGITVHQLRSIDPTLSVMRSEAVFVGVGIWDLYSVIYNWGTRLAWDKSYDEAVLLENMNDFSDLWWIKSKAAWSTTARENVFLRTTYKASDCIHLVGLSTDDTQLFPSIPPLSDPANPRMQTDLQGWSIESLSSNTVQVTLLEQRDPRYKSSIHQMMAGVGDMAIKQGAPPVLTSLNGGKISAYKYDLEQAMLRVEYHAASPKESVRPALRSMDTAVPSRTSTPDLKPDIDPVTKVERIECQVRCDADTWANSIDIMVDPPPTDVTGLRRHKVTGFGGLWLTIEHKRKLLGDEKVTVTIRKAANSSSKEKGTVFLNGTKVRIDVEDLPTADIELLKKQKRTRPQRQPLDRPAGPALRRRQTDRETLPGVGLGSSRNIVESNVSPLSSWLSVSTFVQPLTTLYGFAADAVVPVAAAVKFVPGTTPAEAALEALQRLLALHSSRDGETTAAHGWVSVGAAGGFTTESNTLSSISPLPFLRSSGIVQGSSAAEIYSILQSDHSKWDNRIQEIAQLESFGYGISTDWRMVSTSVLTLPMRSRGFITSSMTARSPLPGIESSELVTVPTRIFLATTSAFDPSTLTPSIDIAKCNTSGLTLGHIALEGWIIEDLDFYAPDSYELPSSKCTYVSVFDYGAVPLAVNTRLNVNRQLPILANLQRLVRQLGPRPTTAFPPTFFDLSPVQKSLQRYDELSMLSQNPLGNGGHELVTHVKLSDSTGPFPNGLAIKSVATEPAKDGTDQNGSRLRLIAEVYLETRHILQGFTIKTTSCLNRADDGLSKAPLPLTFSSEVLGNSVRIPFSVEVEKVERSLLRTTSDSAVGYTVRLYIVMPGDALNKGSGLVLKSGIKPFVPGWLSSLRTKGALVKLQIMASESQIDSSHLFEWDGKPIDVRPPKSGRNVSLNDTQSLAWPCLKFSSETTTKGELIKPAGFPQRAIGIAEEFTNKPLPLPVKEVAAPETPLKISTESSVGGSEATPQTPLVSPPAIPTRSASIYNFLSYPARFRTPSASLPSTPPVHSGLKTTGTTPSSSPQIGGADVATAVPSVEALGSPVAIGVLVLVGLICLLLGSLLRSLLVNQEDFVVFLPSDAKFDLGAVAEWQRLRRLGQVRFFGWNLVLGAYRRGEGF